MNGTVLGGFSEFRGAIASSSLQEIADHWNQARADRLLPAWSDLSPRAIARYLKQVWAFNHDPLTGDFTARLACTRVMMGFGKSCRGTPLKDLHPPHVFERVHAKFSRAISEPAAYRCSGKLFKIEDQIVEGERIVLPLASDGLNGDGVLGASDFKYPFASGPVELLDDKIEWFSV